jgi:neutral ceramidase
VKSLEDTLRASIGPNFSLLFGTGTCGNINHRDVSTEQQRTADTIGPMIGESILAAIREGRIEPVTEPALAVRSTKVAAPLRSYTAEQTAKAKADLPRVGTRELSFLESVEACTIADIDRLNKGGYPGELEVQAFRLGHDTAVVMLPSEIFVELGLAIKAASPFKTTLVIELANDDLAYTPTRQAFAEGSYEITNSRIEPGTGEKLVDAAIGLLKELR